MPESQEHRTAPRRTSSDPLMFQEKDHTSHGVKNP